MRGVLVDAAARIAILLGPLIAAHAAHAAGDAIRGRQLYESRCIGCHSIDANRVGPAHRGLFGRKAGALADFDYSPALRKSTVVWNEQSLERWLFDPEGTISGQRMNYSVSESQDRADIIEYLRGAGR